MTLHWWMHWFWITFTTSPAFGILVFFVSLTASPQVYSQQSSVPALLSDGPRTLHIRQAGGLSSKAQPTSLPHRHQDSVKNVISKRERYGRSFKYSNDHSQIFNLVPLLSKNFSLFHQTCVRNFVITDDSSEIEQKNISSHVNTTEYQRKLSSSKEVSELPVFLSVLLPLLKKNKVSKQNLIHKTHPSLQIALGNKNDFDVISSYHKVVKSSSKDEYLKTILPYCVSVLKNILIPSNIDEATGNDHLVADMQHVADNEDSNRSQNKISSVAKLEKLVRRKKSVNLQSSQVKYNYSNELFLKSSTVYSKVITKMLTESISNIPVKVQTDSNVKSDIFVSNGNLGKWFSAKVKKFNNSELNISQIEAANLNNRVTDGIRNISKLIGSLSLVLDVPGHEGTENSTSDATHETKNIEKVFDYPSFRSGIASSSNESTNVTDSHKATFKSEELLPVDVPSGFAPVTDYIDVMKTGSSLPTRDTVFISKNVQSIDGNLGDSSLSGYMNTDSSVNTDFPSSLSTLPTVQQETDHTQNKQLSSDTEEIIETVAPVVQITYEKKETHEVVGSEKSSKAALITGIIMAVVIFVGLSGTVLLVLFRRHFLNKPQTFNDKCSNPDSSGYIDDSTLRENSEEMYSLDNDSFLNSLEAMTIQNYWTDNVKHTKL